MLFFRKSAILKKQIQLIEAQGPLMVQLTHPIINSQPIFTSSINHINHHPPPPHPHPQHPILLPSITLHPKSSDANHHLRAIYLTCLLLCFDGSDQSQERLLTLKEIMYGMPEGVLGKELGGVHRAVTKPVQMKKLLAQFLHSLQYNRRQEMWCAINRYQGMDGVMRVMFAEMISEKVGLREGLEEIGRVLKVQVEGEKQEGTVRVAGWVEVREGGREVVIQQRHIGVEENTQKIQQQSTILTPTSKFNPIQTKPNTASRKSSPIPYQPPLQLNPRSAISEQSSSQQQFSDIIQRQQFPAFTVNPPQQNQQHPPAPKIKQFTSASPKPSTLSPTFKRTLTLTSNILTTATTSCSFNILDGTTGEQVIRVMSPTSGQLLNAKKKQSVMSATGLQTNERLVPDRAAVSQICSQHSRARSESKQKLKPKSKPVVDWRRSCGSSVLERHTQPQPPAQQQKQKTLNLQNFCPNPPTHSIAYIHIPHTPHTPTQSRNSTPPKPLKISFTYVDRKMKTQASSGGLERRLMIKREEEGMRKQCRVMVVGGRLQR